MQCAIYSLVEPTYSIDVDHRATRLAENPRYLNALFGSRCPPFERLAKFRLANQAQQQNFQSTGDPKFALVIHCGEAL